MRRGDLVVRAESFVLGSKLLVFPYVGESEDFGGAFAEYLGCLVGVQTSLLLQFLLKDGCLLVREL
jgi:hypothetical protein